MRLSFAVPSLAGLLLGWAALAQADAPPAAPIFYCPTPGKADPAPAATPAKPAAHGAPAPSGGAQGCPTLSVASAAAHHHSARPRAATPKAVASNDVSASQAFIYRYERALHGLDAHAADQAWAEGQAALGPPHAVRPARRLAPPHGPPIAYAPVLAQRVQTRRRPARTAAPVRTPGAKVRRSPLRRAWSAPPIEARPATAAFHRTRRRQCFGAAPAAAHAAAAAPDGPRLRLAGRRTAGYGYVGARRTERARRRLELQRGRRPGPLPALGRPLRRRAGTSMAAPNCNATVAMTIYGTTTAERWRWAQARAIAARRRSPPVPAPPARTRRSATQTSPWPAATPPAT